MATFSLDIRTPSYLCVWPNTHTHIHWEEGHMTVGSGQDKQTPPLPCEWVAGMLGGQTVGSTAA